MNVDQIERLNGLIRQPPTGPQPGLPNPVFRLPDLGREFVPDFALAGAAGTLGGTLSQAATIAVDAEAPRWPRVFPGL